MNSFGKAATTPADSSVEDGNVGQDTLSTQGEYGLAICHDGGDDAVAESVNGVHEMAFAY